MGIAHINEPHFLPSIKHTISLTSREKITPAIEKKRPTSCKYKN